MSNYSISAYKANKEKLHTSLFRDNCWNCYRPTSSCYCEFIQRFNPNVKFVILIHPIEWKRKIATGRMAHLSLINSHLIKGEDYSNDDTVNTLIEDKENQCFVIYPSVHSVNLSEKSNADKNLLFNQKQKIVFFLIDGTWHTAKKTMHVSKNLQTLPCLSFVPPKKSNFKVRKQPQENCLSTIEAIHHLIELTANQIGFDLNTKLHDSLIHVFNKMNEKQFKYVQEAQKVQIYSRHPKTIENLKRKFNL